MMIRSSSIIKQISCQSQFFFLNNWSRTPTFITCTVSSFSTIASTSNEINIKGNDFQDRKKSSTTTKKSAVFLIALALGFTFYTWDETEYYRLSLLRSFKAFSTVIQICYDYAITNKNLNKTPQTDSEMLREEKNACHLRSAKRLLQLCRENGGIYIKLGQHLSSLVYLLPKEYTSTLSVLQDDCPPSTIPEIEAMVLQDLGKPMIEIFVGFDPNPLGIASLAQVHKTYLKESGLPVAVKFQHPRLDKFTPIDIETVASLVGIVKKFFPDFQFEWLAKEMKESLQKEMDFCQEAENALRVTQNFYGTHLLTTPRIYWKSRRILCMELIDGSRIDDLKYMETHKINPIKVSQQLSKAFFEMIFNHGFVHCDPHPGNVFVRAKRQSWFSKLFVPSSSNYELVLLDHGLYRSLSDEFQYDYARLWMALIDGNESLIEECSYRLFQCYDTVKQRKRGEIKYHRLFASMLTGRSWEVLSSKEDSAMFGIAVSRTDAEMQMIQNKASGKDFIVAISEILAAIPRELVLLLKTNDLLRAVDHSLKVDSGNHLLQTFLIMAQYCSDTIFNYTTLHSSDGWYTLGTSYLIYYKNRLKLFWINIFLMF